MWERNRVEPGSSSQWAARPIPCGFLRLLARPIAHVAERNRRAGRVFGLCHGGLRGAQFAFARNVLNQFVVLTVHPAAIVAIRPRPQTGLGIVVVFLVNGEISALAKAKLA
jgi:hypothetical protein